MKRWVAGSMILAGALYGACPAPVSAADVTNAAPDALTLAEAFRLALAANPDIRIARLDAERSDVQIEGERGRFDPVVFADLSRGEAEDPTARLPITAVERDAADIAVGLRRRLTTGTDLALTSQLAYDRDGGASNALDPEYVSRVSVTISQDLLRNFGTAVNRAPIRIRQNNAEISREALRAALMQNLFEVERAYWNLYFALADVRVRREQMTRARELVRIAAARVEVGDAPPIEMTRAQASAASQAVSILDARNRSAKLRHRLLQLMGVDDPTQPAWACGLADEPPAQAQPAVLADALAVARSTRPDVLQAEWEIRNADVRERVARNQRLPSLRLYGDAGLQGLDDEPGGDALPPGGEYYDWEVGLRMEVPLPDRGAGAAYRDARLARAAAREQADAVRLALTREVADAVADVCTAVDRVARAREARELAERLLQAEQKSFTLGRTESFNVLDAQAALADAERDEVGARTDYAIARANLYRVQGNLLDVKNVSLSSDRVPE